MRNVEHKLIFGGIEHIVERHGSFGKAEVGAHMAAVIAHAGEHTLTHLAGQRAELIHGKGLEVAGRVNVFDNHCSLYDV